LKENFAFTFQNTADILAYKEAEKAFMLSFTAARYEISTKFNTCKIIIEDKK